MVDSKDESQPRISEATHFVDWEGPDDPERPINWPIYKKVLVTIASGSFVFVIAFSSSAFAPARVITAELFDTSEVVMSLGVSLFIVGFAIGPLFFAPLSEVIGHAAPLAIGLGGCAIFQIPFALATNIPVLLVSRFLQGSTAAAIMSVGTGMFAEVYEPVQRGVAVSCMACCMNLASAIAPIACSFIVQDLGWRWIGWITLIFAGAVAATGPVTLRETSPRIILLRKARRLRKKTGNSELRTKHADDKVDFGVLLQKYLLVPVKMFWTELILVVLTVYLTFVYGTLYLSYQMFPIAFRQRGWSAPASNLPFAAVGLGIITAWGAFSIFTLTWFKTRRARQGSVPEDRLPPMIAGSFILPVSLLWFGWTGSVHWASQVIACFFIGMSLQLIFMSGVVFIVDCYGPMSNCAMSIQVVFRSFAAASFPLWSPPMYRSLQVSWSSTLLAGIAALLLPFPILFMRHGARIRKSSKYTAQLG
ncbi:uncharacterized protein HMPREF1541_05286 [Cyphellophora europaea CBS 101466]|uniref:Major facilitator superfamily (MFS) profile domain-containing protein n=1 Tax=Cyphellophora europaea (strain CBS 101466) TaxID=1220924 RepID=W2RTM7_CYPE1|nr:uncharacterized protein HMPREF1541_05286 [Cyphellophora europaea CBS 101466]ETN39064.1 hypothetical protein HMPREF1541_05286 [Cyphellophora europaea CBS 101466]